MKEFAITALWCLLGTVSSGLTLVLIAVTIRAVYESFRKK